MRLLDLLIGAPKPVKPRIEVPDWDPEDDEDVQYLRAHREQAERAAAKLQAIAEHPSRNALANSMARRGEV